MIFGFLVGLGVGVVAHYRGWFDDMHKVAAGIAVSGVGIWAELNGWLSGLIDKF
jgi:hypothetical protein